MTNTPLSPNTNISADSAKNKKISTEQRWLTILTFAVILCAILAFYSIFALLTETEKRKEDRARFEAISLSTQEMSSQISTLQKNLQDAAGGMQEIRDKQLSWEQSLGTPSSAQRDILLADIEQSINLISQQLTLTGNIRSATAALHHVYSRVARLTEPRFTNVRRALEKDLAQLKPLASNDLTGAALKLDQVIAAIDSLPLLSSQHPTPPLLPSATPDKSEKAWLPHLLGWGKMIWENFRESGQRLLEIRRIDDPDALLITPEQTWLLREHIKLRLLNARMALLAGNQTTLRKDFTKVRLLLERYFDNQSAATKAIQTLLNQAQQESTVLALPTLEASMTAIRQAREH